MTTLQVHELPAVDKVLHDVGFQLRLDEALRGSSVRMLPNLPLLATLAALSFHPDGKIAAEFREWRMTHLSKQLATELAAIDRVEACVTMDVDKAKQAVELRRELKRQFGAVTELSSVKHLGVCWQGFYLARLSREIAQQTGWAPRRVLKAVTELVAAVLHAAKVQIWFDEPRLRDLLRSAIQEFERDPRHAYLLERLSR
jgi:hypothetical protein